jgi:adenylate cyclase
MGRQSSTRAVLFVDISQSGSIYQKLGDTAALNIITACIETLTALLPHFEGVLTKTLGDAMLCVFPSVDLAVRAAGEMQAVIANTRPGNYSVGIHIGIAHGRVILEGGDVFGDTVNVAAYLTAVALREQILATETAANALSPPLKSCIRPVFQTLLKGSTDESMVFQVLWKTDRMEITDVNFPPRKTVPGDTGSLMVSFDETRVRLDRWRPSITIGRGPDCDLVVPGHYASRQHLTIRLARTRFYLIDHSINGTFVSLKGGPEMHVLRQDMPLEEWGELSLGRPSSENPKGVVRINYDRRSMFRV